MGKDGFVAALGVTFVCGESGERRERKDKRKDIYPESHRDTEKAEKKGTIYRAPTRRRGVGITLRSK